MQRERKRRFGVNAIISRWVVRWIPYASRFPFLSSRAKRINIEARFRAQASTTFRHRKKNGKGLKSGEGFHPLAAEILVSYCSRCCALIRVIQWCTRRTPLQSKTSSHADKKATTGKIADVPVPKTDERTVCTRMWAQLHAADQRRSEVYA